MANVEITTVASVPALTAEDVEARKKANTPRIFNFVGSEPVKPVPAVVNTVVTSNSQGRVSIKELDTKIVDILAASTGPQSPRQVHAILETEVAGFDKSCKFICDKMWQLEKKGLLKKAGKGLYTV